MNLCKCGCGGIPKQKNSKFIFGHYSRVMTEEHKRKNSEAQKGKHLSKESREKLSKSSKGKHIGKNNGMYGRSAWTNKHHSEKTLIKMKASARKKEKAWNWKGGITTERKKIKHSDKYKNWRSNVFIRDNFTCQKCFKKGGKLEAHHIKRFIILLGEAKNFLPLFNLFEAAMLYSPLWDLMNGITLCKECHKLEHKGSPI